MIRTVLLLLMLMVLTACSEFAMLMSAGSVAATQNTYTRVYNGLDILTYMSTEKGIKGHAYDSAKKAWTEAKERKGYIYDQSLELFKTKK